MGGAAIVLLAGLGVLEPATEPVEPAATVPTPPTLPSEPEPVPLPTVTPAPAPAPAPAPTSSDTSAPPAGDPWSGVPLQRAVPEPPVDDGSGLLDPWHPRQRGRAIAPQYDGDLRNPFEHDGSANPGPIAQLDLRDPFAGRELRLPAPQLQGPVPPPPEGELRDPFGGRTHSASDTPCAPPPATGSVSSRCLPAPPRDSGTP